MKIQILITDGKHMSFAKEICELIETSAKLRGTGIACREVTYIEQKIITGNAVIALHENQLAGFCYIEIWNHGKFVANSGLVVHPDFRQKGLARAIKKMAFESAKNKYPSAKIFGITTSPAVMKINTELGYRPVSFAELTQDDSFWKGCQSCSNYDILQRNEKRMCLCTGMLAPSKIESMIIESQQQENAK